MDLRGCRAVVTGASSGIGRRLCLDLARAGSVPVLVARRERLLDDLMRDIRSEGGCAESYPCDVSDTAAYREATRKILEAGRVDVLINNAGFGFAGPLLRYRPEEVDALMRTNFLGAVTGIAAFAPAMKARGRGHIVNLASVAGLIAPPYLAAYAASKFALVALGRSLRYELGPYGVGVSVICPGVVDTPFFDAHPSLRRAIRARRGPLLSAEAVSRATLEAIRKNRGLVVLPRSLAVLWVFARWMPERMREWGMRAYARRAAGVFGPA